VEYRKGLWYSIERFFDAAQISLFVREWWYGMLWPFQEESAKDTASFNYSHLEIAFTN
jgi:hypothetical protein